MNKERIEKIIIAMGISLIFIVVFIIIANIQCKTYAKIFNEKLNSIISKVSEKYPNVTEEEILEIVNSKETSENNILQKYGFEEDISNIKKLKEIMNENIIQNTIFLGIFFAVVLTIFLIYIINQDKKIQDINTYLRRVNNGDYTLKIEDNREDELSKLRNELYKTTVLLKEAAENNEKERINLSNSLADISHQLKTPLTSIRIMLDNISENPNMPEETREDFIREITKQTEWISSLVISLLKIAKFDAGTIKMENEEVNIKKLIDNVIANLSIMLEIKEIEVVTEVNDDVTFLLDYKWQLEAITNILKNAIEHSKQNSKIYITVQKTSVFLKIKIRDTGTGIEKKDINHIFDRFYKTKTDKEESIGIGLSLAKTIIEGNNGYVKVESEINKGTIFEIKYLR